MSMNVVNTYLMQSICLLAVLTGLFLSAKMLWFSQLPAVGAICIAVVFQLVACLAYSLGWKKVLAVSVASLPTFYMAASALRMFAGIATVIVYCLVVDDKAAIRFFVITFLIYYFVILAFDTFYFVKAEKKINKTVIN